MELSVQIRAQYDEVAKAQIELVRLSKEYESLKTQLQNGNLSTSQITTLNLQLDDAYLKMKDAEKAVLKLSNSVNSNAIGEVFSDMSTKLEGTNKQIIDAETYVAKLGESLVTLKGQLADAQANGDYSQAEKLSARIVDVQAKISEARQALSGYVAEGINEISAQSDAAAQKAQALKEEISSLSLDIRGHSNTEEVAQKLDLIKQKINEYGVAVAQQSGNAEAAFSAQESAVKNLEKEMENMRSLMQQAAQTGNTELTAELAGRMQGLAQEVTQAKEKLAELGEKAKEASAAMAKVGLDQAKMEQDTTLLGYFSQRLGAASKSVVQWSTDTSAATDFMGQLTETLDGMGLPISKVKAGINGMTKASIRFILTPLGAVITAIVLALKAMHTYLTKDKEGQVEMAAISAYFGSIMESITDIVVEFGKILFHAFADNEGTMHSFAENWVITFKKAFGAVKDLLFGVGNILKGVFTFDWETLKEGSEQLWNGLKESADTVVSALKTQWEGLKGSFATTVSLFDENNESSKALMEKMDFGKIVDNADKAAKLAREEAAATKETAEAKEQQAAQQKIIAEKQADIYKLQGKEKDAAIEELKVMKKEQYDAIIKAQQKMLNIQKEKNDLHTKSLKSVAKERDLNIQLLRTQAQQAASTRMLERMQASNARKMESDAKSQEKKTKSTSNAIETAQGKLNEVVYKNIAEETSAMYSLEEAVAKARIDAMRDGAEKTQAERELQFKEELLQLDEQRQKAIEAERKRQKAEFDAQQAVIKANGGKISVWDDDKDYDKSAEKRIDEYYKQLSDYARMKKDSTLLDTYTAESESEKSRKEQMATLKADINDLEKLLADLVANGDTANASSTKSALDNAKRQLEWVEQSREAWNSYLSEYGTFLEKRKALDEKFAYDTQYMDKNAPEYKAAEKKYKDNVSKIEVESIKKNMNWEQVFGDLGSVSRSVLKEVEEQLTTLIKTDKNLSIEAIKEISDALNKVRDEQVKRGGLFAAVSAIKNARNAKQDKDNAQRQVEAAADGVLWRDYQNASTPEEKDKIRNESVYDPVTGKLGTFGAMLDRAAEAARNYASAETIAQKSVKNAGSQISQFAQTSKDALGLLSQFGVNVPDEVGGMLDGLMQAGQGLESLDLTKPGSFLNIGNYVKIASGLVDTFTNFLGIFGIGKGNMEDYIDAKEQYDKLSTVWDELIEKKKEYLSLSYGNEAQQLGNEAMEYAEADLTAIRELSKKYLGAWERGSHSQGYKFNKRMRNGIGGVTWSDISAVAGSTITQISDLSDLSSEQLEKIKASYPKWWIELPEQYRDYLNQIASSEETVSDLAEQMAEKLLGVTFDDMKENFISNLKDMSKGASDFTDSFEETMRKALIENSLGEEVDAWLEDFYNRLKETTESDGGKLSREHLRDYQEEYQDYVNEMVAKRNRLADYYGITTTEAEDSQKKSYATASEESISELSGRILANNEALYAIKEQNAVTMENCTAMSQTLQNIALLVDVQRELQDNSYLELQTISQNTARTVKALETMQTDITKIRKSAENI